MVNMEIKELRDIVVPLVNRAVEVHLVSLELLDHQELKDQRDNEDQLYVECNITVTCYTHYITRVLKENKDSLVLLDPPDRSAFLDIKERLVKMVPLEQL